MSSRRLPSLRRGSALLGCRRALIRAALPTALALVLTLAVALAPAAGAQAPVPAAQAPAVALTQQRARNAIHVSAPSRVQHATVYDVTLTGFSRRRATAYLFVDYAPCAPALTTEQSRAGVESDVYRVRGEFAATSGWKSPVAGSDHVCAYLVAPASGTVLASAAQTYQVR